jgi:MYXO-CTERM domain-containing protein
MVGGADRLLAVLDLSASGAVAGDKYQISVFGTGSGLGTTYFADPSGNYFDWSAAAGALEISGGSGAMTTPPPPGSILALTGVISLAGFGWVRRRKPASTR